MCSEVAQASAIAKSVQMVLRSSVLFRKLFASVQKQHAEKTRFITFLWRLIEPNGFEEKDDRVRQAAIEALRQFATKGDPRIIAALLAKLQHTRNSVKTVALELLGELTEVTDQ